MNAPPPPTVLANARIVHRGRVSAGPLSFDRGRVAPPLAGAIAVDLRDHVVFPGLVNAHDHLQLNNIPRVPHDAPFPNSYAWIEAVESHRLRAAVAAATDVPSAVRHWHGALKNLLAGTTTVAHHDPWHSVFDDPGFPVSMPRDMGWSHSLGLGDVGEDVPPRYGPPVRASFADTPATRPWIIHLAEGTDAVARSELAQLDALGCVAPRTVLVHGVGLSRADMACIIGRGAAVVWCPSSNLEMLGCTLDVGELARAGRAALGTDSRLTGTRDVLDELRVAAAHSDLAPRELIALVTHAASEILRAPEHGGLSLGQRADCAVVRDSADPHTALLETRRSDLRAVVRGGAPMIADLDFAEWFDRCGIATVTIRLDGRLKLLASHLARPDVIALEPGLEIV